MASVIHEPFVEFATRIANMDLRVGPAKSVLLLVVGPQGVELQRGGCLCADCTSSFQQALAMHAVESEVAARGTKPFDA